MQIRSLHLEHFRSYQTLSLAFDGACTEVLCGPNGAGTTNLLESIGLLSTGKSFLGVEPEHLIHW